MQQIEDLILIKSLGKGSFGEVYLSAKKDKKKYFATKKIEREKADSPNFKKYFENEINLLKHFNHQNIVKLEGIKVTKQYYYIIMEYINGGGLSECLKIYMERHKKAFPEEIVQYLMKQIIDGLYYLHKQKIIHRDLKLDNIMVNFDSDKDKQNLNMMKATIKIIDFGFATKLSAEKNGLAFSAVGTALNMDPLILNKYAKGKGINLGYDQKADIWSIGTVCYELLIGKSVFDAETLGDLIEKVENGNFKVPKSLSKEVISFINAMLQYDPKLRLSAEELRKHPFLTKNFSQFTKMETVRATKKQESLKKNKTIGSIFDGGEKYVNIKGNQSQYLSNLSMAPIAEEDINESNNSNIKIKKEKRGKRPNSKTYTDNQLGFYSNNKTYTDNQLNLNNPINNSNNNFNNNNINNNSLNLHRTSTQNFPSFNFNATSFYGQNMHPTSQISQSNPGMSMMAPPPQQQQMMFYPPFGVGISQNFGGFYPQNIANQGNLLRTRTYKQNSNLLFTGL